MTSRNKIATHDQSKHPSLWHGCVGAWVPCIGPTGLTLRDWSGRQNHGTLMNMDPSTDWAVTSGRYSLDFDGSNDYVNVASYSRLSSISAFSISFWVMARTRGGSNFGTAMIQGFGDAPSSTRILYSAANTCVFRVSNSEELSFSLAHDSVMRHVCCRYTTSSIQTVHVNGVQIASRTPGATSTSFRTEYHISNSSLPWDGAIDDVRIYSRVLTANEITTLARRRGVAYEPSPIRSYRASVAATGNRRRRVLIGAGS